MSDTRYTLKDAENEVRENVKNIKELYNIKNDDDCHDAIVQICDSAVPIYNYDLLTFAIDNLWFGTEETELGSKNAFDMLKEAIYRHLLEIAYEELEKVKECKELQTA